MQEKRKQSHRSTWLGRLGALSSLALVVACGAQDDAGEGAPGVEGELVVRVADYDDHSSSIHYSLLTAAGEEIDLLFEEDPQLRPGVRVRVAGELEVTDETARVFVEELEVVTESNVATKREALVNGAPRPDYRVATLLVHWGSPDGETVASMRQKVFTGETSTNEYYEEASWGVQGITGDVFGWYGIPDPGGCNYSQIANDARSAAQAAGVNLSEYQQVQYYFPRYSPCSWAGLGSVGSPSRPARDSWYNGASGCVVLAHELGHNYGLMHSRSCGALNASQTCGTQSEYGDAFCVMGGGCWHMNAVQKGLMGWYGGCNMVTVGSDAEFTIAPTEVPSDDIQVLRVPRGNGRFFYIENRMPLGKFDYRRSSWSTLNTVFDGVLIHEGPEVNPLPSSGGRYPYLFDATSNTSTFNDSALAEGLSYTSPEGITITVVSKSEAGAVVRVQRPGGGSGASLCGDGTEYQGGTTEPPPPEPTCTDGEQNGDETDVDCGGTCSTKCGNGDGCNVNGDCQSNTCSGGQCEEPPPPPPDGSVTADVTVTSNWGSGYCADVAVRNGTTAQVDGWTTVIDLQQGALGNAWNVSSSTSGSRITARPLDWNRVLPPGGSTSWGFCASKTGSTWQPEVVSASGD